MIPARRLAATAAGVGLAVGVTAALAIPHTSRSQTAATANDFLPISGRVEIATPLRPEHASVELRIRPDTLHEELREQDPAGGPDWVIRSFIADRVIRPSERRHGVSPVIGHGPCVQIGREVDGQFGWIDGDNGFHPVTRTSSYANVLGRCFSAKPSARPDSNVTAATLVGDPLGAHPVVRGGIVWGVFGQPVRSVSITAAGQTTTPTVSARYGAFLTFRGPAKSPSDFSMTIHFTSGAVATRAATSPEVLRDMQQIQRQIQRGPHAVKLPTPELIDPSTVQIAARTSDPGGGPSWGVTMGRTKSGAWCSVDEGAIVGNRVGNLDPSTGLLSELDPHGQPGGCVKRAFDRRMPLQLSSTFGSDDNQAKLVPARGKLRLQPGRTTYYGIVDPNADLVTITSPRDIRSVVPSGPAHAIIVVYDGVFGGNTIRFDVHMKDGTTRTMTQFAGL